MFSHHRHISAVLSYIEAITFPAKQNIIIENWEDILLGHRSLQDYVCHYYKRRDI